MMKLAATLVSFLGSLAYAGDAFKSLQYLCNENGFAFEQYTVVTEDGYVLGLQRIPGTVQEAAVGYPAKPAVFLQHGIDGTHMDWVENSPDKADAFILSRGGYDVWLGDSRGNIYSQAHVSRNTDDLDYWVFSWEEMGIYDAPAFIDFILDKTGQDQLTYIGHSQGTSQFFAGASLKPDYFKEKVNLFVALAPIAQMINVETPFLHLASSKYHILDALVHKLKFYNIMQPSILGAAITIEFCGHLENFCESLLSFFTETDASVDNLERYAVVESNSPGGSSFQQFMHYAQGIKSGRFARFDYGKDANVRIYGQQESPEYDLSQIDLPVALFSGSLDKLADPADVEWLSTKIHSERLIYNQQHELGHLSFMIAKDMSWFSEDLMGLVDGYATNNQQTTNFLQ